MDEATKHWYLWRIRMDEHRGNFSLAHWYREARQYNRKFIRMLEHSESSADYIK